MTYVRPELLVSVGSRATRYENAGTPHRVLVTAHPGVEDGSGRRGMPTKVTCQTSTRARDKRSVVVEDLHRTTVLAGSYLDDRARRRSLPSRSASGTLRRSSSSAPALSLVRVI